MKAALKASVPMTILSSLVSLFSDFNAYATVPGFVNLALGILVDIFVGVFFFSVIFVWSYQILPSKNPIIKAEILVVVTIILYESAIHLLGFLPFSRILSATYLIGLATILGFAYLFGYFYSHSTRVSPIASNGKPSTEF